MHELTSGAPEGRFALIRDNKMQNFVFAQAVLEHAALSSISTSFADARFHVDAFVDSLTLPEVLVGLGVVLLILIAWRR